MGGWTEGQTDGESVDRWRVMQGDGWMEIRIEGGPGREDGNEGISMWMKKMSLDRLSKRFSDG